MYFSFKIKKNMNYLYFIIKYNFYYQKNSVLTHMESWQALCKNSMNLKDIFVQIFHALHESFHVGTGNVVIG